MVDGTNTPFSTVLIVFRETMQSSASSPCVRPSSVRRCFKELASRSLILARLGAIKPRISPQGDQKRAVDEGVDRQPGVELDPDSRKHQRATQDRRRRDPPSRRVPAYVAAPLVVEDRLVALGQPTERQTKQLP